MTTTRAATAREPAAPLLGPGRYPLPFPGWDGVGVTARVDPGAIAALRRLRRGDIAELGLAILDREVAPAFVGADRWRTDEQGRLDARGTVVRVAPVRVPGVLEVAGRRWALTEGVDVRPGTRIEVSGALDVTDRAAQLARRWRVRGWRRYDPGRRGVPLAVLPTSAAVDRDARYVVDLDPV